MRVFVASKRLILQIPCLQCIVHTQTHTLTETHLHVLTYVCVCNVLIELFVIYSNAI